MSGVTVARDRPAIGDASGPLAALAACLIAAAAVYVVYRAVVLRIEYFDGYQFLGNARALVGDSVVGYGGWRPPFLSIALVPAVAIAGMGARDGIAWLVLPHLVSAFLALVTAGAVFWVYRRALGHSLALTGTALFVVTPYFVRYGAHTLADLPAAGWAAATVALWSRAHARRTLPAYALAGIALGGAVLTKYPLALLAVTLAAGEVVGALVTRRFDARRWTGLVVCGTVAVLVVVGTMGVVVWASSGTLAEQVASLRGLWRFTSGYAVGHDESWRDYGPMTLVMVSTPTVLLAAVGLVAAGMTPDRDDVPFLAWLVTIGGGVVFLTRHTEARYLLPAVPALVYFAARGVGVLLGPATTGARGTIRRGAAAILIAWAAQSGARQAVLDRDPIFRADLEHQAAVSLVRARRPWGRLFWMGETHTFHTGDPRRLPADEFFNCFHYPPFAVAYFTGQRVRKIPAGHVSAESLASRFGDGDAILRTADVAYETGTVPLHGVPPPEIWAVHRHGLRADGRGFFTEDGSANIRVRQDDHRLFASADGDLGTWTVLVATDGRDALRTVGAVELRNGEEVVLRDVLADTARQIVFLKIDTITITP